MESLKDWRLEKVTRYWSLMRTTNTLSVKCRLISVAPVCSSRLARVFVFT